MKRGTQDAGDAPAAADDGSLSPQSGRSSGKTTHARLEDAGIPAEVLARLDAVADRFTSTQKAVTAGRPGRESSERLAFIARRENEKRDELCRQATANTDAAFERVMGKDDILLIGFLVAGVLAGRSIGRIRINLPEGTRYGTGFLVSPDMVLTNNHVLGDPEEAAPAVIDFEALNILGEPRSTTICGFAPERLFFTDKALDITIVALADTPKVRAGTAGLGWHPMVGQQGKIRIGDPVNIIQYPGGKLKSVVLHNSNLMHLENDSDLHPFCWYTSDTERGSSGAPVFNNRWEVIGVHHKSIPKTDNAGRILGLDMKPMTKTEFEANPDRALFWANEGTRTSRIVAALHDWTPASDDIRARRDALTKLWESARLHNLGQDQAREGAQAEYSASPSGAGQEAIVVAPPRPEGAGPTVINLHIHIERG